MNIKKKDPIAILDGSTKNIFVGDSIGYKIGDNTFLPPFMPPFWDMALFHATIEKYRQIDFESLCQYKIVGSLVYIF